MNEKEVIINTHFVLAEDKIRIARDLIVSNEVKTTLLKEAIEHLKYVCVELEK